MGTASYLLVGNEGSETSLHSVNHGAGRVMRRSDALQRQEVKKGRKDRWDNEAEISPDAISDREFRKAMRGIELLFHDGRRIKGEAPQVYKDIDDVMGVVFGAGLATGVARLKPIAVIKE
jgi:tRNA-splicing ligase RtcB